MHETQHTKLFGIDYCVEVVRIEKHSHMLENTSKVSILKFLSFFGTFANKIAQTWFVLHKILQTSLFGIYYYVEVVRSENHNYMIENTC